MPTTSDRPSWMMQGITAGPVENYLYSMLPSRDEVLAEMESQAAKRNIPIVGPAVGRVLHQLAMISGAKNIFEMGSAIGYSTIWWARAVGDGGRVIYTDGDRKNADEARGYFDRAGVFNRITIKVGDALELLSDTPSSSTSFFAMSTKKIILARCAWPCRAFAREAFVADNVLWSGKVAEKNPTEPSTKSILEFNRLLYSSKELFTTILPIRDGLAVAAKL